MYFRQFWQDPRLSFERKPGLDKLVVGAEYIKLIWVPDTFFVNEKTAYFHAATTDNQFVRIFHTGDILRSIRWVVKVVKVPKGSFCGYRSQRESQSQLRSLCQAWREVCLCKKRAPNIRISYRTSQWTCTFDSFGKTKDWSLKDGQTWKTLWSEPSTSIRFGLRTHFLSMKKLPTST